jgi:hypothetical protein
MDATLDNSNVFFSMPNIVRDASCRFFNGFAFISFLLMSALLAGSLSGCATAQQSDSRSLFERTRDHASAIINQGKTDLYLSGYAYHGRGTYSPEKLSQLNAYLWGAGAGKTIRNQDGNLESLYFLGIEDSHKNPQLMAGYAYQWMSATGPFGMEAGAGLTGMLISRTDYFSGFPFPIILPVASVGSQNVKLMFSYVPRLSGNKGNGDVLYIFLRMQFK